MNDPWLRVERGDAPLIVSIPHAGARIPDPYDQGLVSLARARRDADWHVDRLCALAAGELGVTLFSTGISRTVIDVNRDPSGASLYPGQPTTGLCPLITFDEEPLYEKGREPDAESITERRRTFFEPYHAVLADEIARLRRRHPRIVLFEAHSIRSVVPMLFHGELPELNIGTDGGGTCDARLRAAFERICARSGRSWIADGRFRGGWTTRHYGRPKEGVHAIQLEMAMRFYLDEPGADGWPPPWDEAHAAPAAELVRRLFQACLDVAGADA